MNDKMTNIGTCSTCKHWQRIKDNEYQKDMGKCSFLSGEMGANILDDHVYPITERTGIESFSFGGHDGISFEYETKSWFGCIHYNGEQKV